MNAKFKVVRWCDNKARTQNLTEWSDGSKYYVGYVYTLHPDGLISKESRYLDPSTFHWNADEWDDWQYPASEE